LYCQGIQRVPDMSAASKCPDCGAVVLAELDGLCPGCAARLVLADPALRPGGSGSPRVHYFGDYELLEEIGRGGMGVVYRARQVSLNRVVALKMILSGQLASEVEVRRFRAEAEAAANLQHPHIVAIHEIGVHDGLHYFSMDYVEGASLAELARDQPLPAERAARYLRAIAEAIHYAHQRGIVHRDLKPSNVLVDMLDQPRVTDFGLAKRLPSTSDFGVRTSELTITGQVLGAPSYMPPEQAAGKSSRIGVHSDVYALGAIFYHLLTGRPPFVADTLAATLAQVQTAEPKPPRALNPAVPRDLETICLKCLRKTPEDRYATAAELAEDLCRWQAGKPIRARPLHPLQRFACQVRRRPAVALAVLAGVVALASLLAPWRGSNPRDRQADAAADASPARPPAAKPWPFAAARELIVLSLDGQLEVTDREGREWFALPMKGASVDVSPAGEWLCYSRPERGREAIFVCRLDGTGERRVLEDAAWPRWRDDETILYHPPEPRTVWSVNTRSGQRQQCFAWSDLTPDGYWGTLRLAPDRTRLVANPQNNAASKTQDLFICDLQGRNVQPLWEDPRNDTCDCNALWLPGDVFVWCRYAAPGAYVYDMAIVRCQLGATNYVALTDWEGWKFPLAASPDGQRILFVKEFVRAGSSMELWLMDADGANPRRFSDRPLPRGWGYSAQWVALPQPANPTGR
jgi:tRNA A-37 threonylcarbamoyl transferase component Bud32